MVVNIPENNAIHDSLFSLSEKILHLGMERDNVPDGMACLQSSGKYLSKLGF
jgi:hypothetical protein